MAPPKLSKPTLVRAVLSLRVLPVTLRLAPASLKIAPPPPPPRPVLKFTAVVALLFVSKLPLMLRLAWASLKMAPPPGPPTTVWLSDRVTLARLRLAPVSSRMPPPWSALPCVIVRPERLTAWLFVMSKTRLEPLPLMASRPAPGPWMARLFLIVSWPLVSVIVWPLTPGSKTIVSPLLAWAMVSRSDPAPLSRLFRTVRVLRTVRSSRTSSPGRNDRRWGAGSRWAFGRRPARGLGERSSEGNHMMHVSCSRRRSALQGHLRRRADRAPGRGRAGACLARWPALTAWFCFANGVGGTIDPPHALECAASASSLEPAAPRTYVAGA